MTTPERQFALLRDFNNQLLATDGQLGEEAADLGRSLESSTPLDQRIGLESIILRRARPVLAVRANQAMLELKPEDSTIWRKRLEDAQPLLDKPIRAIGRINLQGADVDWIGTGWLVADNVIVTNRHVAERFVTGNGAGFTFTMGDNGSIGAGVDFLQEIDNLDELVFKLVRPLHVEPRPGPDVSFFEIEVTSGNLALARPADLAAKPAPTLHAATIGYPAFDSRIPDTGLMTEIFGNVYDKKRLAPGGVTAVEETRLVHNCSTLGGNSGSMIVDLATGEALGLHFSGRFLDANYAVRADIVKRILDDVRAGRRAVRGHELPSAGPSVAVARAPAKLSLPSGGGSASVTIPLTVTVTLGEPSATAPSRPPRRAAPAATVDDDAIAGEEAVVADYRDRGGYDPGFLGEGELTVDLPSIVRGKDDVLSFDLGGSRETELRYQHYSVVMSRVRRMCFFSAVNIDGGLSRKTKRAGWKWDPRIPKEQQIMQECYGSPPKFSRGHMTRREDPGWGDSLEAARLGNDDSMHVTNATPQMQAFNAPIWLELEDYALSHTREDKMRVSVFTGPYFAKDDPTMHGVRIPRAFWKIIAFIHDDTGKLCATGYEMNQEQSLPSEDEFVFGALTSKHLNVATQVPIRSIEAKSGLSFGPLVGVDPLADTEEGLADSEAWPALGSLNQIRFTR